MNSHIFHDVFVPCSEEQGVPSDRAERALAAAVELRK